MLPDPRYRYFYSISWILLSHPYLCCSFGNLWHKRKGTSWSHFLLCVVDIKFSNSGFERLHIFRGWLCNYTRAPLLLLVLLDAFYDSWFLIRDWFLLLVIKSLWAIFLCIYRNRMGCLKSHVQTLRWTRMIKHQQFFILKFLINFDEWVNLHSVILEPTQPHPHFFHLVALLLYDANGWNYRLYIR